MTKSLRCGLLATLVLFCFTTLPVTAEAAAEPTASLAQEAEWTVMVFMNGDNDLEPYALLDFLEMSKIDYDPRVNVVVQLDRIDKWTTDFGDWDKTLRFRMRRGIRPVVADAIPGFYEEVNMGSPEALAGFVEWAQANFRAKRYLLLMWDHGDGWRLLDALNVRGSIAHVANLRERLVARAEAAPIRPKPRRLVSGLLKFLRKEDLGSHYRTISLDESTKPSGDKLFMREVQDSLEGVLRRGGQKLEVIGFDACLMGMTEVAYALRNVTNVMVGSEENVPQRGLRYDDWLPEVMRDPYISGRALGRLIVDSYEETYKTSDPDTTLSAVDLSGGGMGPLASAISELADELMTNLDLDLNNIKRARFACNVYAPASGRYHGIDLHRFCKLISTYSAVPTLRTRARLVVDLLESPFVIDYYAGSRRQGNFGSRGLAIYFPQSGVSYRSDPVGGAYVEGNPLFPVQFVEDQRWDNFLHAYFVRVPIKSLRGSKRSAKPRAFRRKTRSQQHVKKLMPQLDPRGRSTRPGLAPTAWADRHSPKRSQFALPVQFQTPVAECPAFGFGAEETKAGILRILPPVTELDVRE